MNTQKSTHAMLLPTSPTPPPAGQDNATQAPPRWIHILPAGTFHGRDGRGPYTVRDADALIRRSLAGATSRGIPMDYDHQLEHTTHNGAPAPAAGWIVNLQNRPNGTWAEVEWTDRAAAHVLAREYRYVSPVYYHSKGGEITSIESVSLVNNPNFVLKALAHSQGETIAQNPQENPMRKALAAMLGLHDEAAESAVEDAVRQLQEQNKELAAKAAKAEKPEKPDPAHYVPMTMFETVQKELAAIQTAKAESEAQQLVDAAQAEGKVIPAMQVWARGYAAQDAEGFKTWAALAPDMRPGGEKGSAAKASPPSTSGLTDMEKSIAAACGLTEEAYTKEKGI